MELRLHDMFRNLPDEGMASRAECELSFQYGDYDLKEIEEILSDESCDYPDADEGWITSSNNRHAAVANAKLASTWIRLAPERVSFGHEALLRRKSIAFKDVVLEYLLLKKNDPIKQFLEMAISEPDPSKRWTFLWNFNNGLGKAPLSDALRSELFDLLIPLGFEKQEYVGALELPRMLAHLHPQRAREYFANDFVLHPEYPELSSVLYQGTVLRASFSTSRLTELYDHFLTNSNTNGLRSELILVNILNAAVGTQSPESLPLIGRGIEHQSKLVRRVALSGMVRLQLPHDPIRKSIELVKSASLKSLAPEIRTIGFAANYAREFDKLAPLRFAEEATPSVYRNTIQAIGILGEKHCVAYMQALYEEVENLSEDLGIVPK